MSHYIQRKNPVVVWVFLFLVFIGTGAVFLMPISYYIMKPGSAMDVRPFVHVEENKYPKGGNFLLTTVALRRGTAFDYLASKVTKNVTLIPLNEILTTGESSDQYERRQKENMHMSQQGAIIAAYQYAHKPVEVRREGVEVFQVKADNAVLKERDIIYKVDNIEISTTEDLLAYLQGKKAGEFVNVQLVRNKKKMTKRIQLVRLPGKDVRAGFGIIPVTRTHISTKPSVTLEAEDIGGPSAGLMFTLEILNQLLPSDLTKGFQVAGTGTITPDGLVGQIGGIEQKIIAANREGAYLFFCPKDVESDDENERLAKKKIQELKSTMVLVPVANLKEAVKYLEKMKKAS